MSSIWRRSDGRYCAAIQLDGKRRCVYGSTKAEAKARLAELEARAKLHGAVGSASKSTLADFLREWLQTVSPNLKPRTAADYEQIVRLYIVPHLGRLRLDKVTPAAIQRMYSDLQSSGLRRAPSLAHEVLHRSLRMAVVWGLLDRNPADNGLSPVKCVIWAGVVLNDSLDTLSGSDKYGLRLTSLDSSELRQ